MIDENIVASPDEDEESIPSKVMHRTESEGESTKLRWSMDEVLAEFGITEEDLDVLPDEELE
ncbi:MULTISPECIES: hypothetical protein [Gordonibacter]|uniref:Uncharacterized protein n=1 Tax=Gordonibacter faecis TaxID=3047475 RepID=A0ABT7DQA3_9ACTN|nr:MULTISPECIES: hypothetical protein [unclassified Gordonibacter]MDJ1651734.1 hypothetical protein [Gordonibacter sp. KGMB12511]HIW75730.1 hypothetical protein [Candidatus Gordonibacter avicola]